MSIFALLGLFLSFVFFGLFILKFRAALQEDTPTLFVKVASLSTVYAQHRLSSLRLQPAECETPALRATVTPLTQGLNKHDGFTFSRIKTEELSGPDVLRSHIWRTSGPV